MGKWDRRWVPRRRNYSKKYRDFDYEESPPSPPSPHHPQSNPPPIQGNSGSSWEIEFCKSVRVPWKKVVAARYYMHCYDNVAKWDDSAGEEAFRDAKKRFWEKINCVPYETPLPDEHLYIDEINWNPDIDPKLIAELDREYFNPDDPAPGVRIRWSQNAESINLKNVNPWEQSNESLGNKDWKTDWGQDSEAINSKDISDACKATAAESPSQGVRSHWGQNAYSINSKDVNPWEQSCPAADESLWNKAWETHWGQNSEAITSKDTSDAQKGTEVESPAPGVRRLWCQNASSINSKDVNPWEQSCPSADESLWNKASETHWGQKSEAIYSRDVSNTRKGHVVQSPAPGVLINSKDVNPWEQSCPAADESLWNKAWNGCPEESSCWRKEPTYHGRWSSDDNNNAGDKGWTHVDNRSRGWKQRNFSCHEPQYPVDTGNAWQRSFPSRTGGSRGWTEYGNNSEDRKQINNHKGSFRGSCRKREGSWQHSSRYKTSRFQGNDYMTTQKWQ